MYNAEVPYGANGDDDSDDDESNEEDEIQVEGPEAEDEQDAGEEAESAPASFEPDEYDIYGSGDPVEEDDIYGSGDPVEEDDIYGSGDPVDDEVTAAAGGSGGNAWHSSAPFMPWNSLARAYPATSVANWVLDSGQNALEAGFPEWDPTQGIPDYRGNARDIPFTVHNWNSFTNPLSTSEFNHMPPLLYRFRLICMNRTQRRRRWRRSHPLLAGGVTVS